MKEVEDQHTWAQTSRAPDRQKRAEEYLPHDGDATCPETELTKGQQGQTDAAKGLH